MDKKTERKIKIASNITYLFNSSRAKWFLSFGTLLKFCRDKKFDIDGDIDIGVIGDASGVVNMINNRYKVKKTIINDHTKEILNLQYEDENNNFVIDVYVWKKFDGMYWHTYDQNQQNPKNGILNQYVWKGMRADIFDLDKKIIEKRIQSLIYGRIMTSHGTWTHPLHECPGEGVELCLPSKYGLFLDIAYPDWVTERKQFGVSKCEAEKVVSTCKGLY